MTLTEAIDIATKNLDRVGFHSILANDPETMSYNNDTATAFSMIIEAAKRFDKLSQYSTKHTFADVLNLVMKEDNIDKEK